MRRLIRTAAGLLVWSCCVAGVATGSWIAIDSAGRQIGLSTAADGDHPLPATTTPPDTMSPTAAPTPDGAGPRTTTPEATRGSADPGKMTARSEPEPKPEPEPDDTTGTPAVPVVDRVTTHGGVVELECTGTAVSGYNVQPDGGWSAHVRRVSSSSIEASFRHVHQEIDVRGSCSSGEPEFHDDHDEDDE